MIAHLNILAPSMSDAAEGADVMICDPPYAAKVHTKAVSAGTNGAGVRKRDLGFGHLTPELMLRIASYASQVQRWSAVFCDRESTHLWRAAMAMQGVEYIRTIPWVRWSQPQMSGDRPPTGCEDICIFHRAGPRCKPLRKHWNGPGNRIAYTAKSLRGADKYSCEKPFDLMLALVSDFSDPGEGVFDPCAGAGTTLVAALALGRVGAGVDASADAVQRTRTRLAAALGERDTERAQRWIDETRTEANAIPVPKSKAQEKTYERAQRRLADVRRVEEYVSK